MKTWITSDDCEEAREYLASLFDDPMTTYSGVGDEVAEGWIKKHASSCEKCARATVEANMP